MSDIIHVCTLGTYLPTGSVGTYLLYIQGGSQPFILAPAGMATIAWRMIHPAVHRWYNHTRLSDARIVNSGVFHLFSSSYCSRARPTSCFEGLYLRPSIESFHLLSVPLYLLLISLQSYSLGIRLFHRFVYLTFRMRAVSSG